MIYQKKEKIIFKSVGMLLIFLLIIPNLQAVTNENQLPDKKESESSYQFSIFGMGIINFISINGDDYKNGIFNGELYVVNKKAINYISPYIFFIKDKINNKVYTKNTLPEHFTLVNFSGIGHIDFIDIPRNGPKLTRFFLIGKAQYLL